MDIIEYDVEEIENNCSKIVIQCMKLSKHL
jgi:hypothetical protein